MIYERIAVGLLFAALILAFWCEFSGKWRKTIFSFLFESTEGTIVSCPTCNALGIRPLDCQCGEEPQ